MNTASPYTAETIGRTFGQHGSHPNKGLQLLGHALNSGVSAAVNGGSFAAGAAAGAGSELAAETLTQTLYGKEAATDPSTLGEQEKTLVSGLSAAFGAAAGGLAGGSAADAQIGAVAGKNAVENNAMNRSDGLTPDERNRLRLVKKYSTDIQVISEKISNGSISLTKELADYIYTINNDPKLVIIVHNEKPIDITLIEKERGWRPNKSAEGEQIHSARVAYSDFSNWSVLGKVIVSKDRNNRYRLIPDRYDFEWQPGLSKLPRNIETILGSPGAGTPFKIRYTGEINVKD